MLQDICNSEDCTIADDVIIETSAKENIEADNVIIGEVSAYGNGEEESVSSECEKSTDRESVAGKVSVFTDATVT